MSDANHNLGENVLLPRVTSLSLIMGALWSYFHNDDDDEEEEYTHITYDSDAYWDAKFEEEKNAVSDDDDDDDQDMTCLFSPPSRK